MGVSQQSIADVLSLSRTTVTKILNRDPKYSASESTRDLVFSTAEKLGYDFTTIRRPFKREYGRTNIDTKCEIELITEADGKTFDSGVAMARNIGVGGALLVNLVLPRNCFPLAKFKIRCRFLDLPLLSEMVGECQVVRLTDSSEYGTPELGVRFMNATVTDRKILKDFVDVRLAELQAARAAGMRTHAIAAAAV